MINGIPELSQDQETWLKEVASDYGIIYANMIGVKQANARLAQELQRATAELTALKVKHSQACEDLANLQNQVREKKLPVRKK